MKQDEKEKDHLEEQKTLEEIKNIKVESPEDVQKLLDSLMGSGNKNVKKITLVNRLFPNILVNLLFYTVFILIMTIACEGMLNIFEYDNLYKLVIFSCIFACIDTLGRDLLYSKCPFIVFASFGIVLVILSIVAAVVPAYLIPGLVVNNFGMFMLYIIIVMIFKTVVTNYLKPHIGKKFINKIK